MTDRQRVRFEARRPDGRPSATFVRGMLEYAAWWRSKSMDTDYGPLASAARVPILGDLFLATGDSFSGVAESLAFEGRSSRGVKCGLLRDCRMSQRDGSMSHAPTCPRKPEER